MNINEARKLAGLPPQVLEAFVKKRAKDGKHWVVADPGGGELPGFGMFDDEGIQKKLTALNGKSSIRESFDKQQSSSKASNVIASLKKEFGLVAESRSNDDGSVTVTVIVGVNAPAPAQAQQTSTSAPAPAPAQNQAPAPQQ